MAQHRNFSAYDELLADRKEEQVTLLVNPLAGDGKVQALYQTWGYVQISEQQPSPDGPVLAAMVRAVRPPEKGHDVSRLSGPQTSAEHSAGN